MACEQNFERPARKSLPHDIPLWLDPSEEIYFLTIACHQRGKNQLCLPGTGESLLDGVSYRHGEGDWCVHLFLLMPDHVHAVMSFPRDRMGIQSRIKNWKSWTAKKLGIRWQRDFFEHRLRGGEGFAEKTAYIRNNPVRAGLVGSPEDWPWVLWRDPNDGRLIRSRLIQG
jgi:putative transposase